MTQTEAYFNGKRGILCLTFDDRNLSGWVGAIPLFAKYGAHCSFFVSGAIDDDAISAMKSLQDAGHTVGLHTLNHADAPEYFESKGAQAYLENEILPQYNACKESGIRVTSMAYPNNRRNEITDQALSGYFTHFRAGLGVKRPEGMALVDFDALYGVVSDLPGRRVMGGTGIGAYYNTVDSDVLAVLQKAWERDNVVTFFSHDISTAPSRVGMRLELLGAILERASSLGMAVVGFDELPA